MIYPAEEYYNNLNHKKVICVDFDNTIFLDEWPYVGPIIPGAVEVLQALKNEGHRLILYTQRSTHYPICCKELKTYIEKFPNNKTYYNSGFLKIYTADILSPGIESCKNNGIIFDDVNQNNIWETLTNDHSRKVFMDYLIDDHVIGTNRLTIYNSNDEECKIVNWQSIDKWCVLEGLYNKPAISNPTYVEDIYKIFNH